MGNRGSTQLTGHVAFNVVEIIGLQATGRLEDIRLEIALPNAAFGAALTIPLRDKLDFMISTGGVGFDMTLINTFVRLTEDQFESFKNGASQVSTYGQAMTFGAGLRHTFPWNDFPSSDVFEALGIKKAQYRVILNGKITFVQDETKACHAILSGSVSVFCKW